MNFEIVNRGSVAANGQWRDNVYLSLDGRPRDDILIGSVPNARRSTRTATTYSSSSSAFPSFRAARATSWSSPTAAASTSIRSNEANNVVAKAIFVEPQPLADLVTGNVVVPTQGVYGDEVEVRYTVTNKGAETTDRNGWTDTIWLTRDPTRPNPGKNGGILLGSFAHDGSTGRRARATNRSSRSAFPARSNRASTTSRHGPMPTTRCSRTRSPPTSIRTIRTSSTTTTTRRGHSTSSALRCRRCLTSSSSSIITDPTGSVDAPFMVTWTVQNAGEGAPRRATGSTLSTCTTRRTSSTRRAACGCSGSSGGAQGLESLQSYTRTTNFDLSPAVRGLYVTVIADTAFIPSVKETNELTTSSVDAVVTARPPTCA